VCENKIVKNYEEINQGNATKCRFKFGETTFATGNKNEI